METTEDPGLISTPRPFRESFKGRVNTPHDAIYTNIRRNIRRQWPQVQWHQPNDYKVLLLCGGPGLADAERSVEAYVRNGWKICTVNGTHGWALEHGLQPNMHAMLDARAFNARFVTPPVDGCRYLICSQCDKTVFDALAGQDVHLWHGASSGNPEAKILDQFYNRRWQQVLGGASIGTRAIGLLYLLGMRTVRVFGQDTCLREGQHHAFAQPENDEDPDRVVTVRVGDREFKAHIWMVAQLDDWLGLAANIPDDMRLAIEGDGLLAYIVQQTAACGAPPQITLEN